MAEQLIDQRPISRRSPSESPGDPSPPAVTGAADASPALRLSEKLVLVTTGIGLVHHVDHVLRADHSGWPFIPEVTPFTFSLLGYAVLAVVLLASARPWLRAGLTALIFVGTQAAHLFIETPAQQYHTWAHGVSADPAALGAPNLLGIASPALGLLAAGWSLLLSAALLATLVAFVADARRVGAR